MGIRLSVSAFVVFSLILVSVVAAQANKSPTIFLSSNEVSFFNGDQDSVDATVTNNDDKTHTFTISVFPNSLEKVSADPSINHITLGSGESAAFKMSFSSLFEAEFIPRQFSVTVAATDDSSLSSTKEVVVKILRRSPVFVLSLNTNKFTYQPGETINISSVVANLGGDSFDQFTTQVIIIRGGEFVKRFESAISYLPEKSRTTFSNLYTFDQFAGPGVYSAQIVLKDATGQTLSIKSVNFRIAEISKTSQQEVESFGAFDTTKTINSRNEGNSPSEIRITSIISSFSRSIFVPEIKPAGIEDLGTSQRVTWVFEKVAPGDSVQVVYRLAIWRVWASVLIIVVVVYFAFKTVFTVRISKRSRFLGPLTKDSEVPVSIEVVNRSVYEVRDLTVRDFVPPIARIVPKFETVKPAMREAVGGTEVSWKFDSLRAGEERVMTYRIKPKMDILGTLRLNPATLTYSNKRRQKKSAASGIVIIRTES